MPIFSVYYLILLVWTNEEWFDFGLDFINSFSLTLCALSHKPPFTCVIMFGQGSPNNSIRLNINHGKP